MRRPTRALLGMALLAAGSLRASTATASPPKVDDRRAEADAEFAEAKALMDSGQTSAACAKFARSEELDPRLGRLLNLAFCHEQEGKVASAWHEYTEATSLAEQRGQAEREDFARAHAAAVSKKLAFLLLDLPRNAAGAELDGTSLAREVWSTPIPLDPGEHTIVLTAPGKKPRTATLTMTSVSGVRVLAIPPLDDEAPPFPAAAPVVDARPAPQVVARPNRLPAFIASGVAAVGVGVGTAFGVDAMSKRGAAESHCPAHSCDPVGARLVSEARTSATASTIGFGAAGASAVVALWLFLWPPASHDVRAAWATPSFDPHGAGLRVQGTW